MNIEARPICGARVYPRTQFRTESESGLSHQPLNTRFSRGAVHAPSRAVGISLASGCDLSYDVAPPACNSAISGAISAVLADTRCWRAAADFVRIFTVGLTPRLPPSFASRALVVVITAFVRTPNTRAATPRCRTLSLPLARRWHRLADIGSFSTRRHRPEPALPWSRCRLASDDCQRYRCVCLASMSRYRPHGWLRPLSARSIDIACAMGLDHLY
jgi:hypothetical protein